MATPIFVSYVATVFNTSTSPKTAAVSVQTNDVIVVGGAAESGDLTIGTPSDTVNTYTSRQTVDSGASSESVVAMWTAVAASSTSLTVSVSSSGAAGKNYGFGVWVWRQASVGTSASNGPNGGTAGAPSQAITTGAASSGLSVISDDWNAVDGTSRTWRSVNGVAATEDTYARDAATHAVYAGHHLNAGVAGSATVGLSAPGGQKYSIAVVEVLGIPFPELTIARFVP